MQPIQVQALGDSKCKLLVLIDIGRSNIPRKRVKDYSGIIIPVVGRPENLGLPFSTWTVTVDKDNRVRLLRRQIAEVVPWTVVETGPIECAAIPGAVGGIQVIPLSFYRDEVNVFTSALRAMSASIQDSSEGWLDVVRLLATAVPITINLEPERISLTLPEALRISEQLPRAGEVTVIFGCGNILEIWKSENWYEHVRTTAKLRPTAVSRAIEDLEKR